MKNENTLYLLTVSEEAGRAGKEAFCRFVDKLGEFLDLNAGVGTVCADIGDIADESFCAVFAFGTGANETADVAKSRKMRIAGVFENVDGASAVFALLAAVRSAFPYVTTEADGGKILVCQQDCPALDKITDAWLKTNAEAADIINELADAEAMEDKYHCEDFALYADALRKKRAALSKTDAVLASALAKQAENCICPQHGKDATLYGAAVLAAASARLAFVREKGKEVGHLQSALQYYEQLKSAGKGYGRAYLNFLEDTAFMYLRAGEDTKALPYLTRYVVERAEILKKHPDIGLKADTDIVLEFCELADMVDDGVREKLCRVLSIYEELQAKYDNGFVTATAEILLILGSATKDENAVKYLEKCIETVEYYTCEVADCRMYVAAGEKLIKTYPRDLSKQESRLMKLTLMNMYDLLYEDPEKYLDEYLDLTVLIFQRLESSDHSRRGNESFALACVESMYAYDKAKYAGTLAKLYSALSAIYYNEAVRLGESCDRQMEELIATSREFEKKSRRVLSEK